MSKLRYVEKIPDFIFALISRPLKTNSLTGQPPYLSGLLRTTRDADRQETKLREQENIQRGRSKPTQDFLKPSVEAAFKANRAQDTQSVLTYREFCRAQGK